MGTKQSEFTVNMSEDRVEGTQHLSASESGRGAVTRTLTGSGQWDTIPREEVGGGQQEDPGYQCGDEQGPNTD